MCSNSSNEDYLMEPKSLLNYLNELNTSINNKKLKIKTKSKSVIDFKAVNNENLSTSASIVEATLAQYSQEVTVNDDTDDIYVEAQEDENDHLSLSSTDLKSILPVTSDSTLENITDDEKFRKITLICSQTNGLVFESLLFHLNTQDYNEMNTTLAISLFFTLMSNPGVTPKLIEKLKAKNNVNCLIELTVKAVIQEPWKLAQFPAFTVFNLNIKT